MKRFVQTVALGAAILGTASVANAQRKCYSHERQLEILNENPALVEKMNAVEAHTQQILRGQASGATTAAITGTITIPVYVHVLYNTGKPQENISNAQIQSQIAVMNEDFSATNADRTKTPAEFSGLVANTEIQFTWNTANIIRKGTTKTSWGTRDAMKSSKKGGSNPVAGYLNIWICEIGGGILGYAQFPGGSAATDGVVIGPNYFGSSSKGTGFYLSAPYDKGRTATHEVGHWLNLRHIWGDGPCSADDFVADTPLAAGASYGCPAYPKNSCPAAGNDMTMNYMDYTDDLCMYMFSLGQKSRMRAIFEPGGPRASFAARTGFGDTEVAARGSFETSVYPNPVSEVATVSVSLPEEVKSLEISMIDMQGRLVSTQSFENASGVVEHEISVSNLKAGVYFVNVKGGAYSTTKKLVVLE
jgi:hypothetical protein